MADPRQWGAAKVWERLANPDDLAYWAAVERDPGPRIRVKTIHGAKGEEADNVALLTDVYPIITAAMDDADGMDDETRTFYVGMTRAREALYVVEPQTEHFYPVAL